MKKLIKFGAAAALLGAACTATAQSSVTIAGLVDTFAGSLKNSGDTGSRGAVGSGGMSTSWFGFKGTEDLGGGLTADFALTGFFQADSGVSGRFGGDNLFSRDANVGLSGGFGKLALGRNNAPNFLPSIISNPFGDSFTFSPLIVQANVPSGNFGKRTWVATNAGDTGWSNEAVYTTPSFGGLKLNLHYQFGEVAGDSSKKNIGVNALYFNGPLTLTAYYHDVKVANPNPGATLDATTTPINFSLVNRQKTAFVGGNYAFTAVKLYATYQQAKDSTLTSLDMKDKLYSVGLSVPASTGSFMLGYADTKRTGTLVGPELKRATGSVGYDYFVSKRTDLYAMLMSDKITAAKRASSVGLGIRHRF